MFYQKLFNWLESSIWCVFVCVWKRERVSVCVCVLTLAKNKYLKEFFKSGQNLLKRKFVTFPHVMWLFPSITPYTSLYLCLYPSLFLSFSLPLSLSNLLTKYIFLYIYISISLPFYLSIYLYISIFLYLYISISLTISLCISLYPTISLSLNFSISWSLYFSVSLFPVAFHLTIKYLDNEVSWFFTREQFYFQSWMIENANAYYYYLCFSFV